MPLIKNGAAPIAAKAIDYGIVGQKELSPIAAKSEPMILGGATTPLVDKNDAVPDFVSVTNLQPDDMLAEQRRIQRSGLFQAALQSPALMQYAPTLEDYWALLRKAADEGLKYVNELEGK